MDRNDRDYKSAADKYLLAGDPSKEKQVKNIEESLEMFYQSIQWIENSTTDLQSQMLEVQRKMQC